MSKTESPTIFQKSSQPDFLRTAEVLMNMPEDDADVHIDNDIEDVFDLIEPDNKEEFAEFGSSIKKRHLRNKIAAAKSVIAQAKVRSRPKAKAAAASVVELPVFVPPVAPEVGAIPVCRFLAVVPAAARVIEAPGLSWPWGSFVLGERLPTVDRPHGACWVRASTMTQISADLELATSTAQKNGASVLA